MTINGAALTGVLNNGLRDAQVIRLVLFLKCDKVKSEGFWVSVASCSANRSNSHAGVQPPGVIRSSAYVAALRPPATVEVVESTNHSIATTSWQPPTTLAGESTSPGEVASYRPPATIAVETNHPETLPTGAKIDEEETAV